MYCAVRQCVIVGRNQTNSVDDNGSLWHHEVKREWIKMLVWNRFVNVTESATEGCEKFTISQ